MKKRALIFFFILILGGSFVSAADLLIRESMVMQSRILKQEVSFSVCLPAEYFEGTKAYPVVYLLHGLGDDETSWLEYGRISQYAGESVESGETDPMIFVMPEAFRTYYVNDFKGSFLYQDMFVNELVPYIDSLFRTNADRQHRAVMGYSMGGFGAMILHLKHPDVFGTSVPLSMSVRTDEQYMTEDASGWDDQWGRLFGAPGSKGADRLTDDYRSNSPFYIFPAMPAEKKAELNIYMVNGDEEQTLCRSNEELHILMQKSGIAHEYRVVDGGHSFRVWSAALPGALRFINDAFQGKSYRGERTTQTPATLLPANQIISVNINNEPVTAIVPVDYMSSDRKYPVLYFTGSLSETEKAAIGAAVNQLIEENMVCPMLVVFLPLTDTAAFRRLIPQLEEKLRIRPGYRFRSIAGYRETGSDALALAIKSYRFSSCWLSDAFFQKEKMDGLLNENNKEALKRMTIFIEAPDNGHWADANGKAHIVLREMDVQHEYRVREGSGGFDWLMRGLPEATGVISTRFHR